MKVTPECAWGGRGVLYPFQDARFLARFLAARVDRYSKWRTVSQVTSHEAASACTDQFKIKVRNNESAIMILNFFCMVEQAYALAWKQAFHLEKSWKVHAQAARERRRGSEGRAKKESSPFSPIPFSPPTPAARSLARSRLASLFQMESSLSGCLRRRRMFITEEAWSRARQHQANSTDDITSELSEKDWEPAWGSTIDKRHVWLRISEKGDALAELFVWLFVCFRSSRCPSSPSFVGFV